MKEMNILIVEDEMIVAMMIKLKLLDMGYGFAGHATTGEDAIKMVKEVKPDLIIMDIFLKGKMDGIDAASEILKSYVVPIIFLTGDSSKETRTKASIANPVGYLQKPFMDEELEYVIESAFCKAKSPAFKQMAQDISA
ncbi:MULTISPECIES: response regulator [Methanococcoides]|uniref:Response regulator receiver n=2 Tax=Methanococcoides TaxID=2225 RepID=A0A0E3SRW3_METMT|nr:response regulator [Methanococcoides methylutens]AKB85017.1 Response regulator receiver [Methanococcoides methylutens MM1]